MKKVLLSVLVMLFALVTTSYADDIYGSYKGTINVMVSGQSMEPATDKEAIITKDANGTVTLSIKQFKFLAFDFGDKIVVPGLEAEEEGTNLTIFPNDTPVTIDLGAPLNNVDITVNEGAVAEKVLKLQLTIITAVPVAGTIVEVAFEGTKVGSSAISSATSQKLNVYADGNQVEVKGIEGAANYAIYNIAGNMVKQGYTAGNINVSTLSNGIYLLKMNGTTMKFVKR